MVCAASLALTLVST